jgi:hypothetical protein
MRITPKWLSINGELQISTNGGCGFSSKSKRPLKEVEQDVSDWIEENPSDQHIEVVLGWHRAAIEALRHLAVAFYCQNNELYLAFRRTHTVCPDCYTVLAPGKYPVRCVPRSTGLPEKEICCNCGSSHQSGIRHCCDPELLPCKGVHPSRKWESAKWISDIAT